MLILNAYVMNAAVSHKIIWHQITQSFELTAIENTSGHVTKDLD